MAARKKASAKKTRKSGQSVRGDEADEAESLSFEAAIGRLESLVDRLEGGELALEESLGLFEEGVALSKQCTNKLEAAERRVEQLVRAGSEWLARPFDEAFEDRDADDSIQRDEETA